MHVLWVEFWNFKLEEKDVGNAVRWDIDKVRDHIHNVICTKALDIVDLSVRQSRRVDRLPLLLQCHNVHALEVVNGDKLKETY